MARKPTKRNLCPAQAALVINPDNPTVIMIRDKGVADFELHKDMSIEPWSAEALRSLAPRRLMRANLPHTPGSVQIYVDAYRSCVVR
jgi:hypothetical protein